MKYKYPVVLPNINAYVVNCGPTAHLSKQWRTQWHIVPISENGVKECQTCKKSGFKGLCNAVVVARQYIQANGRPAFKDTIDTINEPIGTLAERAMKKLAAHISEGRTTVSKYWRELYATDDFNTPEKRAQWFFEHRIK